MISLREYLLENSVLNVERARQAGNLTKGENSKVSKNNNSLPSRQNTSLARQNTSLARQTDANTSDTEDIMKDTEDSTTKPSNNIELWDVRDYLFYKSSSNTKEIASKILKRFLDSDEVKPVRRDYEIYLKDRENYKFSSNNQKRKFEELDKKLQKSIKNDFLYKKSEKDFEDMRRRHPSSDVFEKVRDSIKKALDNIYLKGNETGPNLQKIQNLERLVRQDYDLIDINLRDECEKIRETADRIFRSAGRGEETTITKELGRRFTAALDRKIFNR